MLIFLWAFQEGDNLHILTYLESYSLMSTHTLGLWMGRQKRSEIREMSCTPWSAELSGTKFNIMENCRKGCADRNTELCRNKRVGHTHLHGKTVLHIHCLYSCLSPAAVLCLDSLKLVITLLRQRSRLGLLFSISEHDKSWCGGRKSLLLKLNTL